MIIVSISGGLGDQMFQYSAARRLATEGNQWLILDCGGIEIDKNPTKYNIEIDKFRLHPRVVFIKSILVSRLLRYLLRCISVVVRRRQFYTEIKEIGTARFDKRLLSVNSCNVLINGCWQSPKYFAGVEKLLQADFAPKVSLSASSRKFLKMIEDSNAVAVHVRRGDKVRFGSFMVDPSYYARAAEHAESIHSKDLRYFIFSDDIEWTKRNILTDKDSVYVDCEGQSGCIEDFILMSYCEHSIIAASGFSWWAAWLSSNRGQHEDALVIAPGRWWNGEQYNYRVNRDHYPSNWKVLDMP